MPFAPRGITNSIGKERKRKDLDLTSLITRKLFIPRHSGSTGQKVMTIEK